MRSKQRGAYTAFVVAVSFFGLLISISMLEEPIQPSAEFGGSRIVVFFIYAFICIAGILAVFFPGPCAQMFGIRRSSDERLRRLDVRATKVLGVLLLHGHHPVGRDGSAIHEFRLGKKNFCPSCFGLLAGGVLSLVAITVFLFSGWTDGYLVRVMYFVGVGGAVLGLISTVPKIGTWARFVLGAMFVTGTCSMLIATDVATANLTADLLVIFLSVFWLLSRISLSHKG